LNVQLFNTDPCPNKSFKFDKGFEVLGFSDIMEAGCTEGVLMAVLKLFVPIFGSFANLNDLFGQGSVLNNWTFNKNFNVPTMSQPSCDYNPPRKYRTILPIDSSDSSQD
jgi:hypothetical protein